MKNKTLKMFSAFLATGMCLTAMSGCGQNARETSGGNVPNTDSGQKEDTGGAAPAHIVMTYLTNGQTPPELSRIQDAVNEISIPAINVEVEFKPIAIFETFSQYPLWMGSGEDVDLVCIAYQNIGNYINSGQIVDISGLLEENAPTISGLSEEFPLYEGAKFEDGVYGVTPVAQTYGTRNGIITRKDYFEETGIEYKDQYSIDEISEILGAIKENHPDIYPLATIGQGIGSGSSQAFFDFDNLGANANSGVLIEPDSTTIVNLFETEEYYNYLLTVRDWYEKEYIIPDAATTSSTINELLSSGKCSGYIMNTDPASVYGTISDYGWESVALHFTEGSVHSMSSSGNTYWTVPITCSDQAAAVKFLDLMYSNQEIAHILTDGIEGVDYVKVDDTHITYPDGVTQENAGFYRVATMFGDRRHEYFWEPELSVEANDEWTAINEKNVYRSFGYAYDSSDMTNQIIAIGTVLDQYLPTLETGSIDDVEGTYDQMISALKTAGIDEVIADNQTQFNEWLSNQ